MNPKIALVPEETIERILDNQRMILGLLKEHNILPNPPEPVKQVYTPKEAVEYLQLHIKTSMTSFQRKVKSGDIKTSPGSSRHFFKKDLDKFINNPN